MQSRFWVASYPEYIAAHDAKEALQVLNEDRVYQIRRGKDQKHNTLFRVVERLKNNEAVVVNYPRNNPKKRRFRYENPI